MNNFGNQNCSCSPSPCAQMVVFKDLDLDQDLNLVIIINFCLSEGWLTHLDHDGSLDIIYANALNSEALCPFV